ncbi:MAG: hypothetical protein ACI8W9_001345, partial [Psychromonas sp.]
KSENLRCVAPIEKRVTITLYCVLLCSPTLRLTKHFEVTWVYSMLNKNINWDSLWEVSSV